MVYQGQYLPSLSINYFAIDKDFEKLAMKWCQFTCSRISPHWELFFQNCSQELFHPMVTSLFVKLKQNL